MFFIPEQDLITTGNCVDAEVFIHVIVVLIAILIWRKWGERLKLSFGSKPIYKKVGEQEVLDADYAGSQPSHMEDILEVIGCIPEASRLEKLCCKIVFLIAIMIILFFYFSFVREINDFYHCCGAWISSLNWSVGHVFAGICVVFMLSIFIVIFVAVAILLFFGIFIAMPPIIIYGLGIALSKLVKIPYFFIKTLR